MAEVEIGIYKSARQAYGFDDIAIVPSRRTRDPEDVDISWQIDAYKFELPVLGSAMDGAISPATAIEMGRLGGLGVLNLEGLWTLAFEALTSELGLPLPRSLTLSNVPSSVPVLLAEVAALLADLDGDAAGFDAAHVCRSTPRPPELLAAYAPGHPGHHWRGVDVIADWSAPEHGLHSLTLPVLLLAAEHDFVTLRSMQAWQQLAQQHLVVIPGAAHHALLEQPEVYGACLESFLRQHESASTNNSQHS